MFAGTPRLVQKVNSLFGSMRRGPADGDAEWEEEAGADSDGLGPTGGGGAENDSVGLGASPVVSAPDLLDFCADYLRSSDGRSNGTEWSAGVSALTQLEVR